MSESTAGGAIAKGVIEIDARADGVDATIAKVEGALTELGTAGRQAGAEASAGIAKIGDGAGTAAAKVVDFAGRAKKSVNDLGEAGRRAADGSSLPRLGAESEQASKRIEASARSITNSIQRQIAMMEAGGKATSDYYALLAQQRGVDPARLKPYLDQLDQVSARQQRAGQTSGEMAAAMRTLPAQFTDIATSLASGQDPMLVLLQQGGQLKDMFGGVGPAARAMGQYLLGLVNPYTVAAAAAATLVIAHEMGSDEMRDYIDALQATNGAVGVTAESMAMMAERMDAASITQAKAAETLTALAKTGVVAGRNLEAFALSAAEYSRVSGESVNDLAANFAALADDPLQSVQKLDKELRFLSATLYDQINDLVKQGEATEAAELAQKAYADALNERTPEMEANLGTLEKAWRSIVETIKEAGDGLLALGRQQSVASDLVQKKTELALLRGQMPGYLTGIRPPEAGYSYLRGGPAAQGNSQAKQLQTEIDSLQRVLRLEGEHALLLADQEATRKAGVTAAIDIEKALDSAASKSEKMEKALAKAGRNFAAAAAAGNPVSAADQEKIRADIRKRYAEKPNTRGAQLAAQVADAYGDMERNLRKQLLTSEELTTVEKIRLDLTDKRYKHLSKEQKSTLLGLAEEVDAFKQQQKLYKEMAGAAKELAEADTRRQQEAVDAAYQSYQRVADQVKALQQEADTYGLSAGGMQDYLLAKAEERLALEKSGEARVGVIEQLEREIAERQKLAGLQRSKDVREAGEEAAKRTADEWKRTSDQISDALTDALMKGFDDGKSFAENFADTLENTFKTMVLRPMVQAIVQPVGNAIGQAFGGQMGATGQSGAAGSSSMFSGSTFGAGSAASMGNMIGQVGNWTGSASTAAYGAGWGLSADQAAAAAAKYTEAGMEALGKELVAGQQASASFAQYADAAGYVMAAYNGIKAVEQGRWGTAVGTAIGAFTPLGPLGAAIGGQIGGMVDDMFGGGGGPKTGGEGWTGSQRDEFYTPGESDRQLRDTVRQLQAQYIGMAVSLGGSAKGLQFGLGFDSDPSGSAGDRVKSALYGANGQQLYSVLDRGVESAQDGVKAEANRLLVAALQQSDLPASLAKVLSGIDVAIASEESLQSALDRVQAIGRIEASFKQLTLVFPQLNGLSLEAKERLAELSGGVGALESNLGAFYSNFVPEEEKRAQVLAEIEKELAKVNVRLPTSRQQFREVAEQLQASGQAGSEAFAKLMGVAGAFAAVTEDTQKRMSATEIASGRRQLEIALMEASGDAAGALAARRADELAAMDASLRGLQQQVWAAQAAAEAQQRYNDALDDAKSFMLDFGRSINDWRAGLRANTDWQSPQNALANAQTDYAIQLAKAQAGDRNALSGITGYADRVLQSALAYYGSTGQGQDIASRIEQQLIKLPELLSPEQLIVDELKKQGDEITRRQDLAALQIAAQLGPLFDGLDGDQSGGITFAEMKLALGALATDDVLKRVLTELDINGDGQISKLEAVRGQTASVAGSTGDMAKVMAYEIRQMALRSVGQDGGLGVKLLDGSAHEIRQLALRSLGQDGGIGVRVLSGSLAAAAAVSVPVPPVSSGSGSAGTSSGSVGTPVSAIDRLYQSVFGRDADASGKAFYESQLAAGRSLADIQRDLAWAKANGSHADGLDWVPFDGYRAVLHKGEAVLTADENRTLTALVRNVDWSRFGRSDNRRELDGLARQLQVLTERVTDIARAAGEQRGAIARATIAATDKVGRTLERDALASF